MVKSANLHMAISNSGLIHRSSRCWNAKHCSMLAKHKKYKTELCASFTQVNAFHAMHTFVIDRDQTNFCAYGARCCFLHIPLSHSGMIVDKNSCRHVLVTDYLTRSLSNTKLLSVTFPRSTWHGILRTEAQKRTG